MDRYEIAEQRQGFGNVLGGITNRFYSRVHQRYQLSPRFSVALLGTQSIASSGFTNTAIQFDTVYQNQFFTYNAKGLYQISFMCQFAINGTGARAAAPSFPGQGTTNPNVASVILGNGTYSVSNVYTCLASLAIGDVDSAFVGQDSGGNLNVTSCSFSAIWISQ